MDLKLTSSSTPNEPEFELQPVPPSQSNNDPRDPEKPSLSEAGDPENVRGEAVPPESAVEALQRWNSPRINMYRVFSAYFSFLIIGLNDGAYGALIPPLEIFYGLNYTVVSLIFLSPFMGYTLAALFNNAVHIRYGQRGIAIIASVCHLVSYTVIANHPPWPAMVVMFVFIGFGNGLIDAAWGAWISNMTSANQVSGFLNASYSLGAMVAPIVVTLMTSKGLQWHSYYYVMISMAVTELVVNSLSFWKQTGQVYQAENPRDPNSSTGRTREALKSNVTWLFALFIFGYMGIEVSLGGWIVTFMSKARSATSFQSGASSSGFWGGMTVGRAALPFLATRLGEFRAVIFFICVVVALQLLFWLVPSLIVSAVAVAFLGLFMGPVWGTSMVLVAKIMPRDLHVGSIGFATAFGGSGGAVFPFMVGAIVQKRGVKSLQPVITALLVVIGGLWYWLPRVGSKDHGERNEGEGGREAGENGERNDSAVSH